MNPIDEYFIRHADRLNYIELKPENPHTQLLNLQGVPLPIVQEKLIKGIQDEEFLEEVDFNHVIHGMIYNIAIDPDFQYRSKYERLLNQLLVGNARQFILTEGIKKLQENDRDAIFYFRTNHLMGNDDSFNEYNYARMLMANMQEYPEYANLLMTEAEKILESVVRKDETFPLSYFELGNISYAHNQYIKAQLYFQKAIQYAEDELLKEESRKAIIEIEPLVQLERGIEAMNKGNMEGAIEILDKAAQKYQRPELLYYLGLGYQKTNQPELAISWYKESLDKGGDYPEMFWDMSDCYYSLGDIQSAIASLTEGISIYENHVGLLYNRLLLEIISEDMEAASKDMDKLLEFGNLSDEILASLIKLKEQYKL